MHECNVKYEKQRIVPIRQEFTPKRLLGYVHTDLWEARADWAWGLIHPATSTEQSLRETGLSLLRVFLIRLVFFWQLLPAIRLTENIKEKMIAGVLLNKLSVIFLLALFAHMHNERKLAEVLVQERN